jgi:hypothetical protein
VSGALKEKLAMITRTEAATLLGCPEGTLDNFAVPDTFNGNQILEGFICRQSNHNYGALVICRVNGRNTEPQVIYCTPKLHYPFAHDEGGSGERHYHFPKRVKRVLVYTKLDGTNVCAYSYADAFGERFVTYKARLTPVLQDNRFGPFRQMWQEMLDGNPDIGKAAQNFVRAGHQSLSFELYGSRNKLLIAYDEPLAVKLLFAVGQTHAAVQPPEAFGLDLALKPVAIMSEGQDLVTFYEKKRAEADRINKKSEKGEVLQIMGIEGYVFYILDEDGVWAQWKNKPLSVEDVHWVSNTIPMSRILPTVWNSLESEPMPTVDGIKRLLLEEFTPSLVDTCDDRIAKAIGLVLGNIELRERALRAYKETGLSFRDGISPVMKALSLKFNREDMKRVFCALQDAGVVPFEKMGGKS